MDSGFIEIEILNWEKYNPRAETKRPSWFRFENSLIDSPGFFNWSGDHIKTLLYVFSMASRKNSGKVSLYFEHASDVCKISGHTLREVIQKLVFKQMVTVIQDPSVRDLPEDVRVPCPTDGRTDVTNGTNETGRTVAPSVSPKPVGADLCLPEFSKIEEVIRERGITGAQQKAWLAAFPDAPWIVEQVLKATAWEAANPEKRKKRFARFMNTWMTKDWDKRRGSFPSPITPRQNPGKEAPRRKTSEEVIAEARARAEAEMGTGGEMR